MLIIKLIMVRYFYILSALFLLPLFSWGNEGTSDGNETKNKTLTKPFYSVAANGNMDGLVTFNHRPSIGGGYRNFLLDYSATLQFKRWFEVGVGVGFHHNSVQFYSASDKHMVGVGSLPTYLTAIVYPYHDDERAFYLKGNYGFANTINGARNSKDKSFTNQVAQGGIGYKQFNYKLDRYIYLELSQYFATAKGTYNDSDTYNAKVDYNLQFYAIVLSVGINLTRF